VVYTTTTSNSGAGLTINVNSLGAKSVAKWQGTTSLAAGDIPANKPVWACYDGTDWDVATIGNAPSGGGISGLTAGVIPQAASGTTLANSSPALDNGNAHANGLTYAGTYGLNLNGSGAEMFVGASAPTPTVGTGGGSASNEGTAATALSGADICYSDSTYHQILCSYNGGSFYPVELDVITTQTGTYNAAVNDSTILCNAPSVAFTVTLPASGIPAGKVYHVKNINAAACTLSAGGSVHIDGGTSLVLAEYTAYSVIFDGTQYWIR
jgi:hypothetical protein